MPICRRPSFLTKDQSSCVKQPKKKPKFSELPYNMPQQSMREPLECMKERMHHSRKPFRLTEVKDDPAGISVSALQLVFHYNNTYHTSIGCESESTRVIHGRVAYSVPDLKMGILPQTILTSYS